ncbi:unnamed protein product [Peronospora destructor]|uniref:Uncharacterized protein n=1 Tax=Peronospora destructor TaxID=86335 RepID=A0AAV0UCE4_9STRA|nr:unnamed protein product [Peronospora destructor]
MVPRSPLSLLGDDSTVVIKSSNGTDQYGRFLDDRRRDINPAFFHIAATNILGRFNYSFIVDISAGNEVWNQPVSGFKIIRLSYMTPTDVAKKYFRVDKYPFNDAATNMAVVTIRFTWIAETGENGPIVSTSKINKYKTSVEYRYTLELDDTYHILGGEWLGNSARNHPDFLWLPTRKPDNDLVTAVGLVYSEVKELLTKSIQGDCRSTSTDTQKPATSGQADFVAPSSSDVSSTVGPPVSTEAHSTTQPNSETLAETSAAETSAAEALLGGASPAGNTPARASPAENNTPVTTS